MALARPGTAILLDLDGTLTDPREGIVRCLRHALAIAFYRGRFIALGMFENRVYSGIDRALNELRESGAALFVATSKPQPFAERILEYFNLRTFFHGVYGSDLDGTRSKKGELIAHVLKKEMLSASDAAMVGDRAQDIIDAKANGVFSVGALWGQGSREELTSAGADVLCERPSRLPECARLRAYVR